MFASSGCDFGRRPGLFARESDYYFIQVINAPFWSMCLQSSLSVFISVPAQAPDESKLVDIAVGMKQTGITGIRRVQYHDVQ